MVDSLFLLSIVAFGLGLSLLTYRLVALRCGWPMGVLHRDWPAVPILLGLFSLVVAIVFAAERAPAPGGWVIAACGALLAVFWTGFLRVASQVSLLIAPPAAFALLVGWARAAFAG